MNTLPPAFSNRIIEMYADRGRQWLAELPNILGEYARRWSLSLEPPFPLSYNYVAPVSREDGSAAVLKLGVPNRELLSEIYALSLYDGHGVARLLEADFEHQVFLIERIRPGEPLVNLQDDQERTRIAAQVMKQLWVPMTEDLPLLTVESWTAGLKNLRSYFNDTTGPFPTYLVEATEAIFKDFIPSQGMRLLLHGDLHHGNILSASRQPWLALDPKGVIGEPQYEVGALLRNPDLSGYTDSELKHLQQRRVAILEEILGFDRQRILGWGTAQAVLSAWWYLEDHGIVNSTTLRCAQVLYDLFQGR